MSIQENLVLALMVLAVVCIPALGQTAGMDWVNKGNDFYAQGNYTAAIKAYDKAVEMQNGENATAAYLMKVEAFLRGVTSNKSYTMTVQEYLNLSKNDTNWLIVDVRGPQEYRDGHIKGAMNIPSTRLIADMKRIPVAKVAVYCATNKRSPYAVMALRIFDDRDAWILLDGQPVESGPP